MQRIRKLPPAAATAAAAAGTCVSHGAEIYLDELGRYCPANFVASSTLAKRNRLDLGVDLYSTQLSLSIHPSTLFQTMSIVKLDVVIIVIIITKETSLSCRRRTARRAASR